VSVSQSSGGDVGNKRAVVAKYGDVSDLYVSRSNLSNLCDTTIVLRSPIMNVRNAGLLNETSCHETETKTETTEYETETETETKKILRDQDQKPRDRDQDRDH